jgi:hypothetical protein
MLCLLKCSKCSEIAIVERAQPMNHRDISSTIDRTCAFRVAGEIISGVSYYSVFLVWYVNNLLRKSAINLVTCLFYSCRTPLNSCYLREIKNCVLLIQIITCSVPVIGVFILK